MTGFSQELTDVALKPVSLCLFVLFCYQRSVSQIVTKNEHKGNFTGAKANLLTHFLFFIFFPWNIYEQTVIEAVMQKGDL